MEKLFEHICQKCTVGIPYDEAVQFLLWVYCTLDVLPKEFRGVELSRQDLCVLLSRLAAIGKISIGSVGEPMSHGNPAQLEHWNNIVAMFLRKELSLDDAFRARISRYV